MSLLLTRDVDQYRIDTFRGTRRGLRGDRLHAALLQPLADQVAKETITLDDQNALHGRLRP
jgi:hypothetical protein